MFSVVSVWKMVNTLSLILVPLGPISGGLLNGSARLRGDYV
tara:strand:- start:409 stop:531 length:123 start_codon:yes stop_codon:yes gene_type:complete